MRSLAGGRAEGYFIIRLLTPLQEKYNLSYWEQEVFFKDLDVVIIGSGIVGLSAALHLVERNPALRVVIVERGPLPIGASTRNAGFACFGSMTELLDDLQRMGEDRVWSLVNKRWQGLQRLRRRAGDRHLSFEAVGGYELFQADEEEQYQACMDHRAAFNRILADITGEREIFAPADERIPTFGFRRIRHLIRNGAEGQLHAGKMIARLLALARERGVQIMTGMEVQSLRDTGDAVVLTTPQGWQIPAGQALIATNGFARQLLPAAAVFPARNQVLLTHPVPNLPIRGTFHYDRGYYYFREVDGRLLLGGGRNLAEAEEQTPELGTTPLIRAALTRLLREVVLPGRTVEVDRWWSGVLGVGAEKAPIIERVSPRVAVAVRLGGMGVAIGTLVGEEGAEELLNPDAYAQEPDQAKPSSEQKKERGR